METRTRFTGKVHHGRKHSHVYNRRIKLQSELSWYFLKCIALLFELVKPFIGVVKPGLKLEMPSPRTLSSELAQQITLPAIITQSIRRAKLQKSIKPCTAES